MGIVTGLPTWWGGACRIDRPVTTETNDKTNDSKRHLDFGERSGT